MKRKMKWGLLVVLFSGLSFTACVNYPGVDDYVTDQLAVFTNYDMGVKFKGSDKEFSTYSLGEYVAYIQPKENNGTRLDTVRLPWNYNAQTQNLHNQLQKNINEYLGYAEDNTEPDLGILVSVVKVDNYIVGYNPWWWGACGYWDVWWECGYYPYYPYPYPTIVGSYTVGTTNINMVDLTKKEILSKSVVWTGIIRSLMSGTQTTDDFNSAINDCFKQTKAFQ